MTISGGTGPFSLTASSGLPPGLTAVVNGNTISFTGTPTTVGNFSSGSVTIQDSVGASVTQTFGITINALPTLGALSQTQWTANHPGFSATIPINGGTDPFSNLSVTGLPPGLTASLNGTTITISGTPTTAGTFNGISVSVTDVAGAVATQTYSIVINQGITITPSALPDAAVGVPYSQTVAATGGTGDKTVSYSVTGLPAGLTISPASPANNSFTISGTPTAAGAATITITATDAVGATTTTTLNLNTNGQIYAPNRARWDRG
jgi:hypothetical protein